MDIAEREVLDELIVESKEHLETIEPDLLALEGNPVDVDAELINRIFRGIHSIKGGFGFLGIETIQGLAHVMESVLMKVRDGHLQASAEMVDVLLKGVDLIQAMLADVEASDSVDATAVYKGLQPWLDDDVEVPEVAASAPAPETEPEPEAPAKPSGFIPLGKPRKAPAAKAAKVEETKKPEKSEPAASARPAKAKDPAAKSRSHANEVLRVKVDLLNQLMNLAGELVLARNQIVQSLDRKLSETAAGQAMTQSVEVAVVESYQRLRMSLCEQRGNSSAGSEECDAFSDLIDREFMQLRERLLQGQPSRLSDLPGMNASMVNLDGVTTSLQENIMRTRMQNMETLFGKLPRQVRELGRKTGKEVFLQVEGNEVELDKSIIESLSDPLNHMIRNSLDHGLETASEREAAGKSRPARAS